MNMHSSIIADAAIHSDTATCLRDLLVAALAIVDTLNLPGDVGAHLDMTINRLGDVIPGGRQPTAALLLG